MAGAITFACGSVLTKVFVHYLGQGLFAWAPHWAPYAMAVAILTGLVRVQSAFPSGSLARRVVAVVVAGIAVVCALVAHARSENRDEFAAQLVDPARSTSGSPRWPAAHDPSR